MSTDAFPFHSTKFDGSLHYRFNTTLVHRSADLLALYVPAGERLESYRGVRDAANHMLCLYWTDRHYNVDVFWRPGWQPRSHYVNIATPADWSTGRVHCIDLDLDLILPVGHSEPILDDQDEFEAHRRKWSYPQVLVDTCLSACDQVQRLMRTRAWPFDGSLFAWRPGQPLPLKS